MLQQTSENVVSSTRSTRNRPASCCRNKQNLLTWPSNGVTQLRTADSRANAYLFEEIAMRISSGNITLTWKNPTKFRRFPPPSSGGRWRPTFLHMLTPHARAGELALHDLGNRGGGGKSCTLKIILENSRGIPQESRSKGGTEVTHGPLFRPPKNAIPPRLRRYLTYRSII